ncbi:tetratricopeptide repeat protein [Desulfococcaceae bacterium OttesenSCG-928-F15]|nr:tetratricopeptide repeat protein [Desulfococcaceae bacterium OttesenSCG-928-F15]
MPPSFQQETTPSDQKFPQAPLYNAHFGNAETLSASFCAHLPELRSCLELVQSSSPDKASPHFMVLGARGMGKSTFLRRLAVELHKDPDISASWLTLSFPEEPYTVTSLSELWCALLLSLRECLEKRDPASRELTDLNKVLAGMKELGTKRREEEAFAFLREIRRRRNQGLILCVDNMDLLLEGLASADAPGERDASSGTLWRLRRIISREKGMFWIGSSPCALEESPEMTEAFHNFFKYQPLMPLNMEMMQKMMLGFAENFGMGSGISGERAVQTMERMINEAPERLKVFRFMTGGDARSVMILCTQFAASRKGDAQSDLAGLIDHMTPFYKTRLEGLSEQPRKIAAHLMEAWHPLPAKELAQISDLPVTTVSGQLSRLEQWGLVEKTSLPNNRRKGFQISERLFNAWYLMRHPSCTMRRPFYWLIEFMRLWFSNEERYNLAQIQSGAHTAGAYPDLSREQQGNPLNQALIQEENGKGCPDWRLPLFGKKIRQRLQELLPHTPMENTSLDMASWQNRLAALDILLEACPHAQGDPAQNRAWVLTVKGSSFLCLQEKELIAEKSPNLTDFQFQGICQLLHDEKKFLENQLGYREWEILGHAVLSGKFFPDFPDAEALHHQIQALFQKEKNIFLFAALCLYEKEESNALFVKNLNAAMSMGSDNAHFWNLLGNLWQYYAKKPQQAEKAYRKALAIHPGLASSWNHLGTVLHYEMKRSKEAEEAYKQAISLDDSFSWPWNNLGNLFQYRLRDFRKAEEAYAKAIKLDPDQSLAWNNLGNLLHHRLERFDDAEKAYRTALALDWNNASFWNHLANLLRYRIKNHTSAEEAYQKAIAIDEKNPLFWADLADFFAKDLARYEEAKNAYEKALALDEKNAWLWTDLGDLMKNGLKAYEEAEGAYRKAIALNPDDAFPQIGLGNLLCDHLRLYDEAKQLYEAAIELDKEDPWAYAKLARVLAISGDTQGARENYLLVESLSRSEIWEASPAVKGILLQASIFLEKNSEAKTILNEIVKRSLEEKEAFFRLKEQVWECYSAGLGAKLALLMEESSFSDFLKPFSLALQIAGSGDADLFSGLAPELSEITKMIHDEIFG